MTTEATAPAAAEEKPSHLAYWAAWCPKLGLGVYLLGLLAQYFLNFNDANIFSIVGIGALILGPLAGLVLGIITLLRKPTLPSRKRAWTGIGWGAAILVFVFLLGACVAMLGKAYRDADTFKQQTGLTAAPLVHQQRNP